MVNIVDGDILNAKENIICHQVNCQGVMGSGLAKQIKNKYPNVYAKYKKFCEENKGSCLGCFQILKLKILNLLGIYLDKISMVQIKYKLIILL
jgi:O-acetyl-ADP-ribose deacetylase (regulator of RNase III)